MVRLADSLIPTPLTRLPAGAWTAADYRNRAASIGFLKATLL